mgnify:CR=1 FL=1
MAYSYWQGVLPEEAGVDPDAIYGVLVDFHMGPVPGYLIEKLENAPVYEKIIDYNPSERFNRIDRKDNSVGDGEFQ